MDLTQERAIGERWDCSADDLMVEAFTEALADARVERERIEAAWLGVFYQDQSVARVGPAIVVRAATAEHTRHARRESLCHGH